MSEYGSAGGVLCRPWAAYAALVLAPIPFLVAGAYFPTDREGVTFAQKQAWPLTEYLGVREAWRDCRVLGRSAPWKDDMHVNFLLMTMDSVPFPDIWQDFLKGVPETSYKFYVHCKNYDACKANLEANGLSMIHIIQLVFNAWCVDLLSPMLQLLIVALGALHADRPAKFVIVSADHLPIKPFRTIPPELGKHPGASDICLYPPSFWHLARRPQRARAGGAPVVCVEPEGCGGVAAEDAEAERHASDRGAGVGGPGFERLRGAALHRRGVGLLHDLRPVP